MSFPSVDEIKAKMPNPIHSDVEVLPIADLFLSKIENSKRTAGGIVIAWRQSMADLASEYPFAKFTALYDIVYDLSKATNNPDESFEVAHIVTDLVERQAYGGLRGQLSKL